MFTRSKFCVPVSLLFVMSLLFVLVGCGHVDDESSDIETSAQALQPDSSERVVQETLKFLDGIGTDGDVIEEPASAIGDQTRCPYDKGTSKEELCEKQCSGRRYSWDPETWICTTVAGVGINPFTQIREPKHELEM